MTERFASTASANTVSACTCLEARDLSCVRDDRTLFSGIHFTVAPGEMLLLEGRNGSGKTSMLRILSGIRLADGGEVLWGGANVQKLGGDYHEHVSYVGHRDGNKLDLTPQENLYMARSLGKANTAVRIDQALEHFGLYGFEDVPTRNLSAGQQRRLALARLLVTDATLWILDEPFTSLDRHGIAAFEQTMARHTAAGGMVVLTTHHRVAPHGGVVHRIELSACPDSL